MKKLIILSFFGVFFFLPNLFSQSKLQPCQSGKVFNNCYGETTGKHDKGTYKYLGEFQNNKYHGQGEFQVFWNEKSKDPLEQPIKYEGTFASGKFHGKVKILYRSSIYEINNYHNGVLQVSEVYKKENKPQSRTNYSYNGKIMSEIFFFDPPLSDNLIQVERIYSNSKITREIEYFKNGTTKVINSNETPSAKTNESLEMPYGQDMSFVYAILLLLLVPIFLIFKTSIRKKTLKKNTPRKKTRIDSSQQNFSSFAFWHGQKGLALTFWGVFVGGNILFNTATIIFADNSTLMTMNLVFFIIWNVLSVMGVFNAADIYKAKKIKQGLTYTPATAAKVAVVLLILSGIGNSIPR
jgi:hypothetical protein